MQDLQYITVTTKNGVVYDATNEVFFDLNLTADPLGILMQMVIKMMFTTPGSDSFFKTAGAGFQKLSGNITSVAGSDELRVQIATGIKDIDRQIRSYQSKETSIPKSGRLKRLGLAPGRNIVIIRSTRETIVPIEMVTYDGITTQFNTPFMLSGGSS